MKTNSTAPGVWDGQLLHFGSVAMLLAMVWAGWAATGSPASLAFWVAIALPILHQVFVWISWRLELKSGATSRAIGFSGYVAFFFLLFGGRFFALVALAWVDRGSLGLSTEVRTVVTLVLVLPGIYAMYSVMRYFGMARAAGADHFDPRYREMPLVKRGIFRFTSNGMYLHAFLLFWAIAIGFDSLAALIVAAFSHIYIWVHFYATEKPDMDYLYGSK